MITCPSCGQENPEGFRLCGMCGAALGPETVATREERKVVTVLFCDLVGFTAKAEQLDPEEVRAVLRPYHDRVRAELERRGGTVEKFIGDAVMALFGAPTAHEDDPERAVRAALAIRDFAVEEGLELRIGITTGEALVSLGASPSEGEGMASGDVVNTAARLQSAAPVNGVVVDETTQRATRHAIAYRETEPVAAKGKAKPIAIWEAVEARARFGPEVLDHVAGELVGREREVGLLQTALDGVREERSPQLVTLVGVPGIGKSRLLHELSRIVDAEEELTTWRQGRCLAYGDGVTFWALAEIVKAQAGILEADDETTAGEKLRRAAEEIVDSADAEWVAARLRPLAGLEDESELGGSRGTEAFAAWRRFFEELAAQRPLILVFEDLQWADDGLLDFVDELADWVTDVPMLVVCTARPELLARRPNWGGGKLNTSTIALEPLSDVETARLMATLLDRSVLPADVQQTLLERAGGNPLYAEQFAQLYLERGSAEDLPLPETLQGIISARLDGLPADEKAYLHAGAVVGKVFWTGALGSASVDSETVVHALVRKGFLRRQRRSSVAGELELAFAHALVRDVAYGQLPRAERAARHRGVAEWLVSLGRNEDHAEMLAYHWRSALELASASGGETADLAERTRLALVDAGDRAFGLNAFSPAVGVLHRGALTLADRGTWAGRGPVPEGASTSCHGRRRAGVSARGGPRRPARDRRPGDRRPGGGVSLSSGVVPRTRRGGAAPHRASTGARRRRGHDGGEGSRALSSRPTPHALERRGGGDPHRYGGACAGGGARSRRAPHPRVDDDRQRQDPAREHGRGGARARIRASQGGQLAPRGDRPQQPQCPGHC